MGRMGASEYYNDNLKRLLREDGGQSYPLNQESRDYGQAAYRDARREKTLSVNYRPVQTPYHMNSTYRRNARAAERPKAPMYDSESYRIGERDERRSKIDGVYGRRQSDSGDRSDYASHIGNAQIEYLSNNRPEIIVQDRSDANRPAGYRPTRQWQIGRAHV